MCHIMETPAERLKWARQRAGFDSAAGFARENGVPEVTYRAHEKGPEKKGGRGLSEAAARSYATDLKGVSWAWLITGEGDPYAPVSAAWEEGPTDVERIAAMVSRDEQERLRTRTTARPVETSGRRDLPVYSSAEGGGDGMIVIPEAIDWIVRPEGVLNVQDSFAIYVVGDSMEPRIEHGERVIVDPSRPIRQNDDVVFIKVLPDETWLALIKRLVRRTEKHWVVKQYNPVKEFKLDRSEWVKAYVIVSRTVL